MRPLDITSMLVMVKRRAEEGLGEQRDELLGSPTIQYVGDTAPSRSGTTVTVRLETSALLVIYRGARRTRTLRSGRFRLYGSVPVPFRNFFNPLDGRWTGRSTPVMTVKSTAVTAVKTVGRVSTISESSQAPKVLKCNHHYFISPSCHPIYTSLRATGDSCRSQKKPSPLMRSMVESAAPSSLLGPPHPYVGTQPPPSQRPSLLCNCFRRA